MTEQSYCFMMSSEAQKQTTCDKVQVHLLTYVKLRQKWYFGALVLFCELTQQGEFARLLLCATERAWCHKFTIRSCCFRLTDAVCLIYCVNELNELANYDTCNGCANKQSNQEKLHYATTICVTDVCFVWQFCHEHAPEESWNCRTPDLDPSLRFAQIW